MMNFLGLGVLIFVVISCKAGVIGKPVNGRTGPMSMKVLRVGTAETAPRTVGVLPID